MNRLLVVVCLFVMCFGLAQHGIAQGQAETCKGKPEDQVRQLERDWLAADTKADVAALRRIVADDFIGQTVDGQVLSKDDIIPQGSGPGGFAGATPEETTVRVFGDTAVLMGLIKTPNQSKGIRATLVCQKRPQGWQMIAAHLAHAVGQE